MKLSLVFAPFLLTLTAASQDAPRREQQTPDNTHEVSSQQAGHDMSQYQ